jgi:hypothetical protein
MQEDRYFRQGSRGCLISLVILVLTIFAMVISTRYQYAEHPLCGGLIGGGFPVLFICDDWGGGSPTSSWGKITFIGPSTDWLADRFSVLFRPLLDPRLRCRPYLPESNQSPGFVVGHFYQLWIPGGFPMCVHGLSVGYLESGKLVYPHIPHTHPPIANGIGNHAGADYPG